MRSSGRLGGKTGNIGMKGAINGVKEEKKGLETLVTKKVSVVLTPI
jgi:hypothetical protein